MIIEKDIGKYIVNSDDDILYALNKIGKNKLRSVLVVQANGLIDGVLSDGDFRRWLLSQSDIDLTKSVGSIANRDFVFSLESENRASIDSKLGDRVSLLPILDERSRITAVAIRDRRQLEINGRLIDDKQPCYVIAEVGNNHNGDINRAKRLVDAAKDAGADCVKFQLRDLDSLYRTGCSDDDLGTEYTIDLLKKYQWDRSGIVEILGYCKEVGITALCTPWDRESAKFLNDQGLAAYKTASADLTNHDLLRYIANFSKPMICSTGMSVEAEIVGAKDLLDSQSVPYAFLHCNSTYPTPFGDINLNYISRLKNITGKCVGYSGHERGWHAVLAAVAMGAKIIEKHITLNRNLEGSDHKVSLLPDELRTMIAQIREVEESMGAGTTRIFSQGEMINRENLAKSIVAKEEIKKGVVLTDELIEIRSPGKGLPPYMKENLIGKTAKRDLRPGEFFYKSDLTNENIAPRRYFFKRPFGIPVRYHDFLKLHDCSNFDMIEFHMSYKDLDVDFQSMFEGRTWDYDLVVHAPELFENDHILDLASTDEEYRLESISKLQKVIDVTRVLKAFFPATERPPIVVNVGGFSMDSFLLEDKKAERYALVKQSFDQLDADGVELIIQTMPPFPWHFGGQRYHNLFVSSKDIVEFCTAHKMRVCFDVSHSQLACALNNTSFYDFVEEVGPFSAHLHIADADGHSGEGLQIGDGEIDFKVLLERLDSCAQGVPFIPEIWQGHKNDGEGFWIALDRLEKACK